MTVLLTRPRGRDKRLAALLSSKGILSVECPLFDFEFFPEDDDVQDAVSELHNGKFDWLVLTSATGVEALEKACVYAGGTLDSVLGDSGTKLAVVGRATGEAAEALGLTVDLEPAGPHYSGAELLTAWQGRREGSGRPDVPEGVPAAVLLARSEAASDELPEGLDALGFRIRDVATYRPVPSHIASEIIDDVHIGAFGAVVLASSGSVEAFARLVPPLSLPIVALGRPTARAARARGFTHVTVPAATTPDAIAAALGEFTA